ncbi:hypothetical protein [Anabaena sp. CCY 0017]|uniref:hypothetical protein n=1 Tax=Anabaena sp. CCY 0017 TaxID=3103866 RepID=UPI0039C76210
MSTLRTVVFSQDGEIASLRRNDKNSIFHDGQGLVKPNQPDTLKIHPSYILTRLSGL